MTDNLPPVTGLARAQRRDKGVARKNPIDALAESYRKLSPVQRVAWAEVQRQIDRLKMPAEKEPNADDTAGRKDD